MGATNIEQLDQNVGALDVVLPDECLAEVMAVSAADMKAGVLALPPPTSRIR